MIRYRILLIVITSISITACSSSNNTMTSKNGIKKVSHSDDSSEGESIDKLNIETIKELTQENKKLKKIIDKNNKIILLIRKKMSARTINIEDKDNPVEIIKNNHEEKSPSDSSISMLGNIKRGEGEAQAKNKKLTRQRQKMQLDYFMSTKNAIINFLKR